MTDMFLRLRTLEFWIDNLNPLFLYPEIAKQREIFASLMQSLSRHLRPAPYPYGLLTLRLLGKLGGRNRDFLREPLPVAIQEHVDDCPKIMFNVEWPNSNGRGNDCTLSFPLSRCKKMLELLVSRDTHESDQTVAYPPGSITMDHERVLFAKWGDLAPDIELRSSKSLDEEFIGATLAKQCEACMYMIENLVNSILSPSVTVGSAPETRHQTIVTLCHCLLLAASTEYAVTAATALLDRLCLPENRKALYEGLVLSLSSDCCKKILTDTGIATLQKWLNQEDVDYGCIFELLCREVCSVKQTDGLRKAILLVIERAGPATCRQHELMLVNTAIVAVKCTAREMSNELIGSLHFFFQVCFGLYGKPWSNTETEELFVWDTLSLEAFQRPCNATHKSLSGEGMSQPSDGVLKLVLSELSSHHQATR